MSTVPIGFFISFSYVVVLSRISRIIFSFSLVSIIISLLILFTFFKESTLFTDSLIHTDLVRVHPTKIFQKQNFSERLFCETKNVFLLPPYRHDSFPKHTVLVSQSCSLRILWVSTIFWHLDPLMKNVTLISHSFTSNFFGCCY